MRGFLMRGFLRFCRLFSSPAPRGVFVSKETSFRSLLRKKPEKPEKPPRLDVAAENTRKAVVLHANGSPSAFEPGSALGGSSNLRARYKPASRRWLESLPRLFLTSPQPRRASGKSDR